MEQDEGKAPSRRERRVSSQYRSHRVLFVGLACLTLFGCGVYLGLTSLRHAANPAVQNEPSSGGPQGEGGVFRPGDQRAADGDSPDAGEMDGDVNQTDIAHGGSAGTEDEPTADADATGDTETAGGTEAVTQTGGSDEAEAAIEAMAIPVNLIEISWPTSGEIRQEPGWYYSDTLGAWRYFPGVAISGQSGRDVSAALAGVVQAVLDDPIDGKGIVLSHGSSLETRYYGIRLALHVQGDQIRQGEVIARLQGSDLIFEVSKDGEALNPANYLSQGR